MKALKKTFIFGLMVLVAVGAFAQDFASAYENLKSVVYNDVVAKESEVLAAYNDAAKFVSNDVEDRKSVV